jgi:hypothetical protein
MWAKIAAAFGTPILAVLLVVTILAATHHRVLPATIFPSVSPAARLAESPTSAKPIPPGPCLGRIPQHFAGLAVKQRIEVNTRTFAKVTGHKPQIVEFYNPILKPFAKGQALEVVNAGQIPLIQLNMFNVSAQRIAAGIYDHRLKIYAQAVRKFGCVIVLSLGHEMNGWWYPWGSRTGTTPAEFIAAWRHLHDLFARQGVRNVIWSWDPTHQYKSPRAPGKVATPASEWYPGRKYVDWVGIDGYLNYDTNGHPQNFAEIFDYQLRDIRRVAPHKLVYLAETAVPSGPAALRQIDNLFSGLKAYHLAGLVWFDAIGRLDQTGKHKEFRLQIRPDDAVRYKEQLSLFLGRGAS